MLLSLLPTLGLIFATQVASPADTMLCVEAAKFLRTNLHMPAVIERDTIDDWRTGKRTPGCRITAAGATDIGVDREAIRFYERVRAAGWVRTPDPIDMPTEAALRFRRQGADCLYHVNREPLLGTEAEWFVNERLALRPGEKPYQMFVMCVPEAPAKPR